MVARIAALERLVEDLTRTRMLDLGLISIYFWNNTSALRLWFGAMLARTPHDVRVSVGMGGFGYLTLRP